MKLLDKEVLVAEINRRLDKLNGHLPSETKYECGIMTTSEVFNFGQFKALKSFLNFLDTIEKDVNK